MLKFGDNQRSMKIHYSITTLVGFENVCNFLDVLPPFNSENKWEFVQYYRQMAYKIYEIFNANSIFKIR